MVEKEQLPPMDEDEVAQDIKVLRTVMGHTWDEVEAIFRRVLPPQAYTKVGGTGANLTDINPAYLTEALTEAFGPCGLGWGYSYDPDQLEFHLEQRQSQKREYKSWVATFRAFSFWYRMNGSLFTIPSVGSSDNENPGWALRGAITTAISGACSKLLWQVDVYKGILTHENAARFQSVDAKPERVAPSRPLTPDDLKSALVKRSTQLDGIPKDTDRGLCVGILNEVFAGPNADQDRYALSLGIFGQASSKNWTDGEVLALKAWLKPTKDEDTGAWLPDPMARTEAVAFVDSTIVEP